MKHILDKLIFGLFLGAIFPILLTFLSVTMWYYFPQNDNVLYFVSAGFLTGVIIDLLFLKKWIGKSMDLPIWILIFIYLFYNICMFGLFMGFPVFNLIMGMIAGYYFGKRIQYKSISLVESKLIIKRVSFFAAFIMLLICTASGIIANIGNGAGQDLQLMLRLPFLVTKTMIWGIILIGGSALIIGQYFLTKTIMIKMIKHKNMN